jgi:hypothetical protein
MVAKIDTNQCTDQSIRPLNDEDLDAVSGGALKFTILDTTFHIGGTETGSWVCVEKADNPNSYNCTMF